MELRLTRALEIRKEVVEETAESWIEKGTANVQTVPKSFDIRSSGVRKPEGKFIDKFERD